MGCKIFGPRDHVHHHVGAEESSCFYFPTLQLAELAKHCESFVARAARIEVNDVDAPLHRHEGATIVFITAGSGTFKTAEGERVVNVGDVVYVPPMTPHLSIADPHTTMIEWVVYIGEESDVQKSLPV